MTETRFVKSKDAITGKVTLIPYEVSDEQILAEKRTAEIEQILKTTDVKWDSAKIELVLKTVIDQLVSRGYL